MIGLQNQHTATQHLYATKLHIAWCCYLKGRSSLNHNAIAKGYVSCGLHLIDGPFLKRDIALCACGVYIAPSSE